MQWVWDHSRSRNAQRLVLLAIADCAAEDGGNAYPSNAEIQRKAALSERAIQDAIKALVALGELRVEYNAGRRGTNMYTVIMHRTPAESAPPQNPHPAESAPTPPQNLPNTPAESAPGTVSEPSSNRPSSSRRGTRLPENWKPSEELIHWTRENAPNVGWIEVEKFNDYWHSVPGQRGVKTDWDATWRNWARRAASELPTMPGAGRKATAMQQQAERGDMIRQATANVVANGGSADDTPAVLAELARLEEVKSGRSGELAPIGLDTCQVITYIEGEVVDAIAAGGDPQ